jgi:tetratricopeptide (TPR) repeat protein
MAKQPVVDSETDETHSAASSTSSVSAAPSLVPHPLAGPYYDLGGFHYEVSTDSKRAQVWFDRGLAMCHAFNHEEAVRCFEQALVVDPGMPMALWGMAYALGPNINNMEIEAGQIAQAELLCRLAKLQAGRASVLERELIEALGRRYATPAPEDREPLNRAYADAMRKLRRDHPDNVLVAKLCAEALMNLRPWGYWSPDGTPADETPEIVSLLEESLARWPADPALCHYYIHAMEASPTPGKALAAANRLRAAMPGAGHLVHMPSHIDVLLGDYQRVVETNQLAIEVDKQFLERAVPLNFYSLYRLHNYHFLVYGAMFEGQSQLALATARELTRQVPEAMLREQADFLDALQATPLHVLGALLLEQDRVAEAEEVYRADLRRRPHNVWGLQGLAECLERLGNLEEAADVKRQYRAAARRADLKIDRSCFCRR